MKSKTVRFIFCFCFYCILFSLFANSANAQKRSHYDLAAWMIAAAADDDTATINWALGEGGDINYKRGDYNALTQAIFAKKPAMVKFLLQKGASVDSVNMNGLTALQYAQKVGNPASIELIKSKMSPSTGAAGYTSNEVSSDRKPALIQRADSSAVNYIYKVGDNVLHSRDRGKTWEPGIIKEISTNQDLRSAGISPYLVENISKTDQNYLDPNFITYPTRQSSWTTFFIGDWELYLPMTAVNRKVDRDVYTVISGGDKLPPLRISKDGTYTWMVDKKKVLKGSWKMNNNAPGIILVSGDKSENWLMYNTSDNNNRKIYKTDYIILSPLSGRYSPKHGFRIQKGK